MSRSPILLAVVVTLVLAACVSAEPEFTTEDQVTAEQRAELEAAENAEEPADVEDAETVEFLADDNFYEGLPASVDTGQIEFVMENVGLAQHDMYIEEEGDMQVIELLDSGETGSGTVDLDAGEYTLYCSVPGHREDGMEETIQIEG